ncbi:cytochrome P450 [Suillus decipiens]|nr:cytochrome P450 [Suillus decipiens]
MREIDQSSITDDHTTSLLAPLSGLPPAALRLFAGVPECSLWTPRDHCSFLRPFLHGSPHLAGTSQLHVHASAILDNPLWLLSLIGKGVIELGFAPNCSLSKLMRDLKKHADLFGHLHFERYPWASFTLILASLIGKGVIELGFAPNCSLSKLMCDLKKHADLFGHLHFERYPWASFTLLLASEKEQRNAKQVGDMEFKWARKYGPTWMTKGCLGEEILWTADPHALQYVFHTSGYKLSKRTLVTEMTRLFTGESILTADRAKIMNPAFGAPQLRTYLLAFRRSAALLSQKCKDMIQSGEKSDKRLINVSNTLSKMTLDVIGELAFDSRVGVLDDSGTDDELVQAFNNLLVDTPLNPSSFDIIFQSIWRFFTKTIIDEKTAGTEKGGKDIIRILIQFNHEEDPQARLSEGEMLSQIATLLLGGHDTTASTLTWLLYELSKHPEDQQRIRDKIKAAKVNVAARGEDDLQPIDFNNMFLTCLVIEQRNYAHISSYVFKAEGALDTASAAASNPAAGSNNVSAVPLPKKSAEHEQDQPTTKKLPNFS